MAGNIVNMAVPVIPEVYRSILILIGASETQLTWNINKSNEELTLQICHKLVPKHQSTSGHPGQVDVVKTTHATDMTMDNGPKYNTKKSPSRLARDRKRMRIFRAKKQQAKVGRKTIVEERVQLTETQEDTALDLLSCYDLPRKANRFKVCNLNVTQISTTVYGNATFSSDFKEDPRPITLSSHPPPVTVNFDPASTVMDLKSRIASSVEKSLKSERPLESSNIRLCHIACHVDDTTLTSDPSIYTANIPDSVPVYSLTVDRRRPQYYFMYNLLLFPDLHKV